MKQLWLAAAHYNSFVIQVYYSVLFTSISVGITHGFTRFVNEAIFYTIFLGLILFYARKKPRNKFSETSVLNE